MFRIKDFQRTLLLSQNTDQAASPWRGLVGGFLLGVLAFCVICGFDVLDPTNIRWLLAVGDPTQHFLGWHFFRRDDWHIPLGLNPNFGLAMGSSIVYTDSLPLFALLFKPFAAWLPDPFQYSGLWLLLCFALQGGLGAGLMTRITPHLGLQLLGAALFLCSAPWFWRMHGHVVLAGHWLILAALLLYIVRPRQDLRYWLPLLAIATLIHFYLLVMVSALWAADRGQRLLLGEATGRSSLIAGVLALGVVFGVMWQAGYFALGITSVGGDGFGFFRMNGLALIDPMTNTGIPREDAKWSLLLPDQAPGQGSGHEGFNYLGLGTLLLVLIAGYTVIRHPPSLSWQRWGPLIVVTFGLTLLALSHRWGIGTWEILHIPLPDKMLAALQIIRSSGRLFWPVFYLVLLSVLAILITRYRPNIAFGMILLAVIVQWVDSAPGWQRLRHALHQAAHTPWQSLLQSAGWSAAGHHYRVVHHWPMVNQPPGYFPLSYFAASHGMAINIGYFARLDHRRVEQARHVFRDRLTHGLDQNTLYVFALPMDPELPVPVLQQDDGIGQWDGYAIIAPDWFRCTTCPPELLQRATPATAAEH